MYCKHCGNQLSDTAKFCEKCGKNIEVKTDDEMTTYAPAGIWKRLGNLVIDRIFQYIFSFLVGLLIGLIFLITKTEVSSLDGWWWILIGIVSYLGYFVLFECIWQKTVAKFITKTKVVMKNGSKPPIKNIIGRTFARLIPFEEFSFLFSSYPIGWHDRLSNTLVVPSHYTEDDVKKIDTNKIKNISGGNPALVIVVAILGILVFIAVIGIISSIVLVSLNTARQKGRDAQTVSYVNQMRTSAEIYYDNNGKSYSSAQNCNSGMFQKEDMQQKISSIQNTTLTCYAKASSYAISAKLASPDKNYCIDSSGYSGNGVAVDNGSTASCKYEFSVNKTSSDF